MFLKCEDPTKGAIGTAVKPTVGLTMLDLGHLDPCALLGHCLKVCTGKPVPVLPCLGMEAWVLLVWDAVALG